MNYVGKLYGRITEGRFFDTGHTTKEWDEMVEKINHAPDTRKMIDTEREKEAMLKGWMAARHRYSGVVGGEKPAEMAFEKWYNEQQP